MNFQNYVKKVKNFRPETEIKFISTELEIEATKQRIEEEIFTISEIQKINKNLCKVQNQHLKT